MSPEDLCPFSEHWCDGHSGRSRDGNRTYLYSRNLRHHGERRPLSSVSADKEFRVTQTCYISDLDVLT